VDLVKKIGEGFMKSNHSFSVNFFVRRDREAFGKAPLSLRITIDGRAVFLLQKRALHYQNGIKNPNV